MNLCGERKIASLWASGWCSGSGYISMSMYGAAAAKSQKERASCSCRISAIATVLDTMPVTLEAAEKEPIRSGRSAYSFRVLRSWSRSMWPSASCGIVTTSAIVSRHGISLEWCS